MTSYHIGKSGQPKPCTAKIRCPLGGSTSTSAGLDKDWDEHKHSNNNPITQQDIDELDEAAERLNERKPTSTKDELKTDWERFKRQAKDKRKVKGKDGRTPTGSQDKSKPEPKHPVKKGDSNLFEDFDKFISEQQERGTGTDKILGDAIDGIFGTDKPTKPTK